MRAKALWAALFASFAILSICFGGQEQTALTGNFLHQDQIHILDFKPGRFFLISNSDLKLSCDHEFELNDNSPRNNKREVRIGKSKEAVFVLGKEIQVCQLNYGSGGVTSSIKLVSELSVFPWLGGLVTHREFCPGQKLTQLSCSHSVRNFQMLETPESGFIAKTEMLLGQKLSYTFVKNQNPYAEIDFSKAPKLDAIFLATLVFRADFYGTVMSRLLKFHADRGTVVYILTTGYMMLDKDKKLLRRMAADNGNVRLQEFSFHDPEHGLALPLRYIDNKFRDMHIKLLITLAHDPNHNAVVFGGRNIHDGFLFEDKPNYSKYPDLVQYGVDDDFVHWSDFEAKINAKEIAEVTAAHLLRYWNRDVLTEKMEDFAGDKPESKEQAQNSSMIEMQHLISVPYQDHRALEKLYIALIDGAVHSIKISSPYLRPTPGIMKALQRAIDRKVDITIQTRVSLAGDTQAWLYEEVNKESINALFDKVKIYEWRGNSILHSKFLLIDGERGFIGSVNLSRRSFIQDAENGFLVKNKAVVSQMEKIFSSYIAHSRQILQPEPRKLFPTVIIQILKDQF